MERMTIANYPVAGFNTVFAQMKDWAYLNLDQGTSVKIEKLLSDLNLEEPLDHIDHNKLKGRFEVLLSNCYDPDTLTTDQTKGCVEKLGPSLEKWVSSVQQCHLGAEPEDCEEKVGRTFDEEVLEGGGTFKTEIASQKRLAEEAAARTPSTSESEKSAPEGFNLTSAVFNPLVGAVFAAAIAGIGSAYLIRKGTKEFSANRVTGAGYIALGVGAGFAGLSGIYLATQRV